MTPKDIDKLIERYLEGTCTPEERDFVDAFYASLDGNASELAGDTAETLEAGRRLAGKINEQATAKSPGRSQRHLVWYSGIAAAITLCLVASYFIFRTGDKHLMQERQQVVISSYEQTTNTTDQQQGVILPDGSLIVLSRGATVRYSNAAIKDQREVFLSGEAYFEVVKDSLRPFLVYTGNMVTRVVGTSFTIRNPGGNESITVSVKTGKVAVYSKRAESERALLTPHEKASYDQLTDKFETQKNSIGAQSSAAAELREMQFEETPVSEVLDQLVKSYHIDIGFDREKLVNCVLTSRFYDEGLYERIDVICAAIGATYKVVDAKIIIESEGCQLRTN